MEHSIALWRSCFTLCRCDYEPQRYQSFKDNELVSIVYRIPMKVFPRQWRAPASQCIENWTNTFQAEWFSGHRSLTIVGLNPESVRSSCIFLLEAVRLLLIELQFYQLICINSVVHIWPISFTKLSLNTLSYFSFLSPEVLLGQLFWVLTDKNLKIVIQRNTFE